MAGGDSIARENETTVIAAAGGRPRFGGCVVGFSFCGRGRDERPGLEEGGIRRHGGGPRARRPSVGNWTLLV